MKACSCSLDSKADITIYVDGIAASMASVIALCGKPVQMSKNAMLLQAVGASQKLTAQAAGTKNGTMTWISSNPGVATVSADGMVTAVGDGETMILAVTPEGRADACYVAVGAAAWRFRSEDELAERCV